MIPVLTGDQMRAADRRTIGEIGIPAAVLMENAGAAVAEAIRTRFPGVRRPLVLCGKGNNGGDGFVAARRLLDLAPRVVLLAPRSAVSGDAASKLRALEEAGGAVDVVEDGAAWTRFLERRSADLIVDAILGTGLREAPNAFVSQVIGDANAWARAGQIPVLAVDLPSGVPSDTGSVSWLSFGATLTIALAAPKIGHALPPASERCGEVLIADIGIPRAVLAAAGSRLGWIEASDAAALYPSRAAGSHKGTYGHLLIVAGSVGKTGAAVLAATAALRTGVGLVTVATPAPAQPIVAGARAEVMTEGLPATGEGTLALAGVERALALAGERDAVVIGPGLGASREVRGFVEAFVARCPVPLLVDADGLNALSASTGGAAPLLAKRPGATVITPHPGEMARLAERTTVQIQGRRSEAALDFARASGAMVVLKGHRTIVARPDGEAAVNPTGNPGMAKGGTGDVLAGMMGALLARGAEAWASARAAVYLHGLAGDRAAQAIGMEGVLAGDIVDAIPAALRTVAVRD